ncbi:MAG TPA: hypothetical protein VFQ35_07085 [Polyangiaceae bacterium]|nr:hypothetical protein [Polyangiaceae bacterium]
MRAVFICSILVAAISGCSTDRDAMDKRLAALRDDIARLQADNDRLGERVEALEAHPAPAPAPAKESAATSEESRPPLKVVKLVPNAPPAGDSNTGDVAADERVDAPGNRPVIRLYGRESRDERRAQVSSSRQNSAEER